jgi:prepilin-type N-terminal cleavage/methylation domain-containing protein
MHMTALRRISTTRFRWTSAFTLIELLVVIAIISLLVSILLPSLNRAKELARQVVCATTQRGLNISLMLYCQDHAGQMPISLFHSNTGLPGVDWKIWSTGHPVGIPAQKYITSDWVVGDAHIYSWMDLMFPYTNSLDVYDCPSYEDGQSWATCNTSYGYNGYLGGSYRGAAWGPAEVEHPERTALLDDIRQPAELVLFTDSILAAARPDADSTARLVHLEQTNVNFVAGQVTPLEEFAYPPFGPYMWLISDEQIKRAWRDDSN